MSLCSSCRSPRVLACAGFCRECADRILNRARWQRFVEEVDRELAEASAAWRERELYYAHQV